MARVPGFGDDVDRSRKRDELIRQLRSQKRCHTESKTVIVSGEIVAALYVGPFTVAINPLDEGGGGGNNPEFKLLHSFPGGSLRAGTCTVQWTVNGTNVGAVQNVTTTADENPIVLDPPLELAAGDKIKPTFTIASADAVDYDGPVVMIATGA